MSGQWFTLQTLSGKEGKAKEHLEARLVQENMQDRVFEVLVPQVKVTEVKRGKKTTTIRKFYPGYIFVNADLLDADNNVNEDVWYFIKETNGIINFIGGDCPAVLPQSDIDAMKAQLEDSAESVKPRTEFNAGDVVIIKDGAFENFEGEITDVDPERGKLHISVSIFGRSTPVEVEYWQVEHASEEN